MIAGSLFVTTLVVATAPFLQVLDLLGAKGPAQFARMVVVSLNVFWAYPVNLFFFDSAIKAVMVIAITLLCMDSGETIGPSKSFTRLEVFVYVFVAGMLWTEVKQLYSVVIKTLKSSDAHIPTRARFQLLAYLVHGGSFKHLVAHVAEAAEDYMRSNKMDVGILCMFITSFLMRFYYVNGWNGWYNWLDIARMRWLQREGWRGSEPAKLYDSSRYFTAMGAILMWLRFQSVAEMHVTLGPLLITYRRMLKDVGIWFFIAATTLMAFTAAFLVLLQPDPDGFTMGSSLRFTIMALFGDWDTEAYSFFTRGDPLVWMVFICLVTLTSIVQVNMLIAMMSDTYTTNLLNAKREWRYLRTLRIVEFADD